MFGSAAAQLPTTPMPDAEGSGVWGGLLAVAVLMALNAFFVAAEFALVRVRSTRLKQLAETGHNRAKDALGMQARLDSYLSACQLGVTAASLGLGWVGEPVASALLEPVLGPAFEAVGLPVEFIRGLALVLGFVAITALHIVVGEQAPKVLAIQRAETVALASALPLRAFYVMAYPLIWALNSASNALCRLLGVDPAAAGHSDVHSGEELKLLLTESREGGAIGRAEGDVVTRALDFSHRMVREVMVPRGEVVFLNLQRPLSHNMQVAREAGFTRFPLCDGDLDRVRGVVNLREMLEKVIGAGNSDGNDAETDLKPLSRKAKYMPEQMSLSNALKEFQRTRTHMAMVVDEYGGTVGLLTLEDVLEALVGPIQDEFDEEQPLIQGMGKGVVRVDGSTPLMEVNQALGINIVDPHNGTLGGHITMLLGRLAQVGDRVRVGTYEVAVEQLEGLAVGTVSFIPRQDAGSGASGSAKGDDHAAKE